MTDPQLLQAELEVLEQQGCGAASDPELVTHLYFEWLKANNPQAFQEELLFDPELAKKY